MAVHRKVSADATPLSVSPMYARPGEAGRAPRHSSPTLEMAPDTAYQFVHDELMLDGNARLNLATFVTTWMEPQAERLMAETFDKNMIDKDEYPRTAELEQRCVNMLSRLWNSPDDDEATGTSTTGSSEAAMLAGMALKWRWRERQRAAGKPTDQPNMVMGANVQVCWEKFCRYWDVEARLVPMEGDRYHLTAEQAVAALRREHDRCRRGARLDLRRLLRAGRRHLRGARPARRPTAASTSPCTSTGRRAASSRRSSTPTSCGTSACRGCSRSTPPATSTGSCTPASGGSSGATPTPCPMTSCSRSTTSAGTCRRSR